MSRCLYIGREGLECGRRCFDARCYKHKNKAGHKICETPGCGRGTNSKSGVCAQCPGHLQIQILHKMTRDARRAAEDARRDQAYIEKCFTEILKELSAAEALITAPADSVA